VNNATAKLEILEQILKKNMQGVSEIL